MVSGFHHNQSIDNDNKSSNNRKRFNKVLICAGVITAIFAFIFFFCGIINRSATSIIIGIILASVAFFMIFIMVLIYLVSVFSKTISEVDFKQEFTQVSETVKDIGESFIDNF